MTRMVEVEGANGQSFYINTAHVRFIKASHRPGMCRLVLDTAESEEASVTVMGTMKDLAERLNG